MTLRFAFAIALFGTLVADSARAHPGASSLAAWGNLGTAAPCQRAVAAAAAACAIAALDARAACHEAALAGQTCDAATLAARLATARRTALDAVEAACSEADAAPLGRADRAAVLADAVRACRAVESLGEAPYAPLDTSADSPPRRACVQTTAAAARNLGRYAVRTWRRALDRIASDDLPVGERDSIAGRAAERIERLRRVLAAAVTRRCGGDAFTATYHQSADQFFAAMAQGGNCFAGSVYAQSAVTCPEAAAAEATSGACVGGSVAGYPCNNIDLYAFLPLASIGGGNGNDVWGWTDPETGREYALMGRSNGMAVVDITANPPVYVGNLPTHTTNSTWRGIKVYADHAFVVSEAGGHGMQVLDLRQVRTVTNPPVTFAETAYYGGFSNCHTLAINAQSGFAYGAGTNTCSGGLHMIDVHTPAAPVFAGCVSDDGYTHETQCVTYAGPDSTYVGRELCFSSNTDTLTIIDVTNKGAPVQLSRTAYDGRGYTHQGWLTEDQQYFLMDDETDEQTFGHNTRTRVWDVRDVNAPYVLGSYYGPVASIDHNLYIRGNRAYEANYRSGLRILDLAGVAAGTLSELGFFDIYPANDAAAFNGAWSNYPFFPSGRVAISGIEQGLFVVQPAPALADTPTPTFTAPPPSTATRTPTRTATPTRTSTPNLTITAPTNGQVIGVEGVTFSWTAVSSASGYDLRIVNATTQAVVFSGTLAGSGSTTTINSLPNNGSYIFRVRACSGGFSDATCGGFATRAFSVSLLSPSAAPTITFPSPAAVLTASRQTLTWTAVSGNLALPELYYEVQLDNLSLGQTELAQRTIAPTLQALAVLRTGNYRLRVRACQAGCGPYSSPVDFSAALGAAPASAPTITSAMVNGGNSLDVGWTAVSGAEWYQVQVVQPAPAGPGGGALTVASQQAIGSTSASNIPVPSGQAFVFVAACTGNGCGPFSSATGINPSGPNPAAPNIGAPIGGAVVNGPSVLFTWSRIAGDTGSNVTYRLYVQDLSRQGTAVDVLTTQNYFGALLKAEGGLYAVAVIAQPGTAQEVVGPAVTFIVRGSSAVAPTLTAPTHLSSVAAGNVLFGWSPVPGATLYEYFVAVQGQGVPVGRGVTSGLFVQVPLTALNNQPTVYSASVRACPAAQTCVGGSDAGWGPWSTDAGTGAVSVTVTPPPPLVAGSSLRFNGNGSGDIDRVKIGLDAPSRPVDVGGDFTLELWLKSAAGNASGTCTSGGDGWMNGNVLVDRDVVGAGDNGDYGLSLFGSGGRLAFGVAVGGSGQTICGATNVANGAWHHVAVTRRASDGVMRLYVDGQLDANGSGPTGDLSYRDGRSSGVPSSDPFLVLGAEKRDTGAAFHGWLDELRVSSVVRYSGPFAAPSAPFASDFATAALYHFDEGNGNTLVDSSTAVGGPSNGTRRLGGAPAGPLWSTDTPFTTPAPAIALTTLTTGLSSPTYITHAGDQRLFITELGGTIRIWDGTQLLATPFLTVSGIAAGGEQGLLSMAFHPQYASNGFFYVYYTNASGDPEIARYTVSGNANLASAASKRVLLTVDHPNDASNHNGGQLAFGPDGYLYAGFGDGGSGCDAAGPGCNAQRDDSLLGKIVRLDVDQNVNTPPYYGIPPTNPFVATAPLDEIWAKGVRNPWRFSFDRLTGSLVIGDVGQDTREEVDVRPSDSPGGENFGWKRMEGFACGTCDLSNCPVAPPPCNDPSLTLPVLDYTHAGGNCSITGGFVYRGSAVPNLYGKYLFGDLCSGRLWWANDNLGTWSFTQFTPTAASLYSFGQGLDGELYVARGNGTLARLDAAP
ncbi:MAG: choice-of-anchor B family protein [bacterium]